MKKKIISLMLMFLVFNGVMSEGLAVPTLTWHDNSYLEALYLHDSRGSLSQNLAELNFHYYLDVLPKHIAILENELAQEKSRWNNIYAYIGFLLAQMTACCVIPLSWDFKPLMTDKFSWVKIPNKFLNNLDSVSFTRSEKKKLDRVTVGYISYDSAYYSKKDTYTIKEQETIKYLARRLALKEAKIVCFLGSMIPVFFVAMACAAFYAGRDYPECRNKFLNESLERDKRLIQLLEIEKASRFCARFK